MRQKTIKAIRTCGRRISARGLRPRRPEAERALFPLPEPATESKDNFVLAPEDYAEVEEWGTITGIVHSHPDATTQPSELDKAQCDATLLPGILSAGQKAISVPSTRVVSCRSSSDHSCWATTIAGAGDELFSENPRHRAARLPRRLSVVGKGVSGQFLSGLLV